MRQFQDDPSISIASVLRSFAPPFPDHVDDVVLVADTLYRHPIPTGAKFVVFSFDGDFRAKLGVNSTAMTLPSATATDGAGSELNPTARRIMAEIDPDVTPVAPTHICLRAPAACKGSLSFYG